MKRIIFLIPLFLIIFASSTDARSIYKKTIDVNIFFGALEPYGEWIEIGYNDYVWRPYKSDYNWRPYSDGRWEWTRHGWYWVSYEPFGWATFHYGRWYFDDYYGWVWMPDNVWGPAWVEWRYDDYYIGWAPLPPYAVFNHRHGIHFSIKWNSGYFYWNFVKYNHFISHEIRHHFVQRNYAKRIFKRTKYRTNYFADNNRIVNGGISRRYVERKIGRKLKTREISRTNDAGRNDSRKLRSSRGIVEYTPSEKIIGNSGFDKDKVIKGRELKSLRKDKIAINRRNRAEDQKGFNKNGNIRSPEAESKRNAVQNKRKQGDVRKNYSEDRNPMNKSLRKNNERKRDIAENRKKYTRKVEKRKFGENRSEKRKADLKKKNSEFKFDNKSYSGKTEKRSDFKQNQSSKKKEVKRKSVSKRKKSYSNKASENKSSSIKRDVQKKRSRSKNNN